MTNLLQPTDIDITSVKLTNTSGDTLDIQDLVAEINVYEQLGQPILLADITVVDASGLYSKFPVTGQETVQAVITRGDFKFELDMHVAAVKDYTIVNDFTVTYRLDCVQKEYFHNSLQLVSESYEGNITSIAESIFQDYLYTNIDFKEETQGTYKVVIPSWNPYKAIRWLMGRARDSFNIPFVCYNTLRNGLYMVSLKSLFEEDPVETFKYNQRREKTERQADLQVGNHANFKEIAQTPVEMTTVKGGEIVPLITNGAFGMQTVDIDTRRKFAIQQDYNFEDEFDRQPHLGNNKLLSEKFEFEGRKLNEYPETVKKVYYHSNGSFGNSHGDYNHDVLNVIPTQNSYAHSMGSYTYELVIPGRTDLEVGTTVNLEIQKNILAQEKDPDDIIDRKRSGKHIVTECRHIFKDNQYNMAITVSRDTIGEDYDA